MIKSDIQSLTTWVFAALPLVLPLSISAAEPPAARPNIIFIIVDDMGYRNLGCYGGNSIQTPNIDAMCQEGMRFTDFYSGAPVCAPARSTLMTGYHLGHTPVRRNDGGTSLFPEDVTVAEVLKKAGYITGGFGKWGLGDEGTQAAAERQGFDTFFGYYNQGHAHDFYTSHLFRNSERVELSGPLHSVISNGERMERKGKYSHYAIYEETIKFRDSRSMSIFSGRVRCGWGTGKQSASQGNSRSMILATTSAKRMIWQRSIPTSWPS